MEEINEKIERQLPGMMHKNAELDSLIERSGRPIDAQIESGLPELSYGNRGHIAARAVNGGPQSLDRVAHPDHFVNHRPPHVNDRNVSCAQIDNLSNLISIFYLEGSQRGYVIASWGGPRS